MGVEAMPWSARWLHALKVGSWPKLLVPMLLGQALGVYVAGRLDWRAALLGFGFTVCDLVFIVLMNDWGDQDVDRIKREMFPDGCSPKTIPDNILPAKALWWAGWGAGFLGVAIAWAAQVILNAPGVGWAGVGALGLFVAYTLPPLRINYRGGGEPVEMFGVGLVLPALNAWMQMGTYPTTASVWVPLIAFALLSLSSALASGLADEESDAVGGKLTCTVLLGNAAVRRILEACLVAGALCWILPALFDPKTLAASLCACAVALYYARLTRTLSKRAKTNAFHAQRLYKGALHKAIWLSASSYAILLLISSWALRTKGLL